MTKKKKIEIGSIILIICVALVVIIYKITHPHYLPQGEYSEYTAFPKSGVVYNRNAEFVFKEKYDIVNEEILSNSYTLHNEDFDKIIKKICKRYDVSKDEKLNEEENIREVGNGDKNITIYGNTTLDFVNDVSVNSEVILDDEECKNIAEKELKKVGLLREYMYYSEITYEKSEEEKIVSKTVHYKREIDGVEVLGNSEISVTIVGDGEIKEIYYSCGEIAYEIRTPQGWYDNFEKAKEACTLFKGLITVPDEYDKIVIEKVECVYWEDSSVDSENKIRIRIIQPVYKFVGKAYTNGVESGDFVAVEAASRDNYYH